MRKQYVLDSDWGDVQPDADAQNAFLKNHTWDEYAQWHLGLTEGANDETKARYAFVYGDLRRIHRTGLIACVYRASEWRHKDIELAAHDLLQYLDAKTGLQAVGLGPEHEVQERSSPSAGRSTAVEPVQQPHACREERHRSNQRVLLPRSRRRRTPDARRRAPAYRFFVRPRRRFRRSVAHTLIARSSAYSCGAHQRLHHGSQGVPRLDAGMFTNRWRSWSCRPPQASMSADAVGGQVGEMPVEAALGDPEPLAESVDAQRVRAAVGEEAETGLNPVLDRKPASGAARRGHARQHTTTSNVTRVKISGGNESRQRCCCNRGRR